MPVTWQGLDELERQLAALPETVTAEADPIAERSATSAAATMRADYPFRTGELRAGVQVRQAAHDPTRIRWSVVNLHPLATIFEYGTQARHTELGAFRGSMPAGKVFIPTAQRARAQMYEQLRELLRAQGAIVTG